MYAIVTRSSCEQERVQLTAMFFAAEPCVNSCCVYIAVSKNICQMLQIMLCPIEAHGEQMPQVMGKDFLRRNPGCGAQLLHPSPDSVPADGLTMPPDKYWAKSHISVLKVAFQQRLQSLRQ